jgi:NADPH:quinone reductase
MLGLFAEGAISPHVSEVFPLSRVADALHAVADRQAVGKVVVDPTA